MGNSGVLHVITEKWQLAMYIALIFFSLYSAFKIIDDNSLMKLATDTNTTTLEKMEDFSFWAVSLNALNPAFRYELPFIEGYVISINDIPAFDATDLIFLIPLSLPLIFILRANKKKGFSEMLWKILFIIIYLAVAILVVKVIWYLLYLHFSSQLGMSGDQAIAVREKVLLGMTAATPIMLLCSGFGLLSLFKMVFGKR